MDNRQMFECSTWKFHAYRYKSLCVERKVYANLSRMTEASFGDIYQENVFPREAA